MGTLKLFDGNDWQKIVGSGGETKKPELLKTITIEDAVTRIEEDLDLKGHLDFVVNIRALKNESATSISGGYVYQGKNRYCIHYYSGAFGATSTAYPYGSAWVLVKTLSDDIVFQCGSIDSTGNIAPTTFQLSSNDYIWKAPKFVNITKQPTESNKISFAFNQAISNITVTVYGL